MKNILFILIFAVSIFALPNCCLTPKLDSLKAVPEYIRSPLGCNPTKYYADYDEPYNSNTCESFQFSYSVTCGNGKIYTSYRFNYRKLNVTTYFIQTIISKRDSRYSDPITTNTITWDTVRNWCDAPSIEKKESFSDEKILKVNIFDIQGKLISSGKMLNINNLSGIFLVQYVTDKRIYFKKKLFY